MRTFTNLRKPGLFGGREKGGKEVREEGGKEVREGGRKEGKR